MVTVTKVGGNQLKVTPKTGKPILMPHLQHLQM